MSNSLRRFPAAAGIVLLIVLGSSLGLLEASSQSEATSTPIVQITPTFDVKRLEKPAIASDNSEQLKNGSILYWGICMSCHGDRGQGLTDEWRDGFGAEDRDCWRSGCHGENYPAESFFMPADKVPRRLQVQESSHASRMPRSCMISSLSTCHGGILASSMTTRPGR